MALSHPQEHEQDALRMSEEEYLAFEEKSETKHEYSRGRVYAMSGGSVRHSLITTNISTDLNVALEDTDCKVVASDTRVKVEKMTSYCYPDVMVYCGDEDYTENRTDTLKNPRVIVEVLSPSTALKDRNEKMDEYTESDTLQEYVLVSQHEAKVEVFTRQPSGKWLWAKYKGMDAIIELTSIDCKLELARIYRKVTLDVDTE